MVALIQVDKLDDNKAIVLAMILQPLLLFKFDVIITQYFWKEVCLDQGYKDFQKVLDHSSQCVLIYSQETKKLLFQNQKAKEIFSLKPA